jgi:hypothetical protein
MKLPEGTELFQTIINSKGEPEVLSFFVNRYGCRVRNEHADKQGETIYMHKIDGSDIGTKYFFTMKEAIENKIKNYDDDAKKYAKKISDLSVRLKRKIDLINNLKDYKKSLKSC